MINCRIKNIINIYEKSNIQASEGRTTGKYPFYTSSSILTKYIDVCMFKGNSITMGTGGVASINYVDCDFSTSTDCYNFTAEQYTKFVYYYLLSKIDIINDVGFHGMGLKHLQKDFVNTMKISIPKDYTKIANFLDEKLSDIDNAIEKTKETIEDYKKYKQAIITKAVTKGLDENAEMKDSGIEWIGMIPKRYEITKFKNMYKVVLGKMLCNDKKNDDYTIENYLCSANIKWDGIDTSVRKKMWFSSREKEQYLLIKGDLLITEGGSVGESSIYNDEFKPCYIQNAVHRVRGKNYNINKYAYYWMRHICKSGYLDMICNKATLAHYTKEKVEDTPIICISVEEQLQIVNFLDNKCNEIDNLIKAKEKIITELENYKKSVIYEYVTGKKEVK